MSCPTYSGNHLSVADALAVAEQAGFSPQAAQTFVSIEQAESGLDIGAISCPNKDGSVDRGIAQINSGHNFGGYFDPVSSAQFAYALSNGGTNFTPWSTYNNGAYLAFLGQTQNTAPGSNVTMSVGNCFDNNAQQVPALPNGKCPPGSQPLQNPILGPNSPLLPHGGILGTSQGGGALEPSWLKSPIDKLTGILSFLTTPKSWLRIAGILAGIALVIVGAHALLSSGSGSTINLSRAAEAAAA